MSDDVAVYLGPYGNLQRLERVGRPMPVPVFRPASEATLLSGRVATQRAPVATRRWRLAVPWGAIPDLRVLVALEQGTFGPPPWRWYDPMAAQRNLLPAAVASPGVGEGADWWLPMSDDPFPRQAGYGSSEGLTPLWSVHPDGETFPRRDGEPDPVPVLPGATYTLAVEVAEFDTAVSLVWVDAGGAEVSVSSSGSGQGRLVVTATAPVGAIGFLVRVEGLGRCEFFQVTETPAAVPWYPGEGVPRVAAAGLEQVYQLATRKRTAADVAVVLVEVG